MKLDLKHYKDYSVIMGYCHLSLLNIYIYLKDSYNPPPPPPPKKKKKKVAISKIIKPILIL